VIIIDHALNTKQISDSEESVIILFYKLHRTNTQNLVGSSILWQSFSDYDEIHSRFRWN